MEHYGCAGWFLYDLQRSVVLEARTFQSPIMEWTPMAASFQMWVHLCVLLTMLFELLSMHSTQRENRLLLHETTSEPSIWVDELEVFHLET